MTATATSNIATTTSATLCSEDNSNAAEDSDSDRDSQTRAKRERGNFASQTVRLLREERGVQVETDEKEVTNEERKEGERSELARLRVSLIEAKVV